MQQFLEETFREHLENLERESEGREYGRRADGILSILEELKVSEETVEHIPHPEYLPYMKLQSNGKLCGTCALRAALMLQFGYLVDEGELWKKKIELSEKAGLSRRYREEGTGPKEFALIWHKLARDGFLLDGSEIRDLSVFMTLRGNVEQLAWLIENGSVPVINRYFPKKRENGTKGNSNLSSAFPNHYEVVFGVAKEDVFLFNPANDVETSGIRRVGRDEFMNYWWPVGENKYRWYITAVPKSLEKEMSLRRRFGTGKHI